MVGRLLPHIRREAVAQLVELIVVERRAEVGL
jgi:hypothetical protein